MTRICLDTSAYSHFRKGDGPVTGHLDRADWIGVPGVVIGELWAGFLLGSRLDRNVAELDEFLDHPVVEVLPVDADVAQIYGEIIVDLRRAGRPLPTNDIWIAAIAVRAGGTVLTFDEHFREIGRVGAIVLPQPSPD